MTRVLMCSNDLTFAPALTQAYQARGYDVTVGLDGLDAQPGAYDVIHLHWPEELVGWGKGAADRERTQAALAKLDRWRGHAVLIATVHNLVPHNTERTDGPEAAYFREFYERIDLICHYSRYSRQRYVEVYPALDPAKHIVQPLNCFAHLLPLGTGRAAARQALGLDPDEPVFAAFGALRKQAEAELLQKAWSNVKRRDARLLLASRPSWAGVGRLGRIIGKVRRKLWLRDPRIVQPGFHPDDAGLVRLLEAADAVLVPRLGQHLNSGLVPLAFTFGTAVIAPDNGPNGEIIPLPANELYAPGDATALARAIERQAEKPADETRAANLAHMTRMGWGNILNFLWPRVIEAAKAKGLPAPS